MTLIEMLIDWFACFGFPLGVAYISNMGMGFLTIFCVIAFALIRIGNKL